MAATVLPLAAFAEPHIALGLTAKYGLNPSAVARATGVTQPTQRQPPSFVNSVLKGIGAPVNSETTSQLQAWMRAEGGPGDNPLNTTLGQAGAQGSAIKGYGSTQAAINATVKTLKNGLYQPVIDAFRSNPGGVRQAVINSPWDVNHYSGTDYAKGLVSGAPLPSAKTSGGGGGGPKLPGQLNLPYSQIPNIQLPGQMGANTAPQTQSQGLLNALMSSGGKPLSMASLMSVLRLPENVPTSGTASASAGAGAPASGMGNAVDGSKPAPPSAAAHMLSAMNQIAGHHYNYEWGGGHNPGFTPASGTGHGSGPGVGYDCSGAISAILHAAGKLSAPMVAQQFMSYGQPGPGTKSDLTIYASPTHVFAEIGGRFFGTSMSNPGGGAGWFQRAQTAGYTIRHVSLQGNPALHLQPNGNVIPFRTA